MLHWISKVLTADELAAILDTVATGNFVTGKSTAGYRAKRVKENEQLTKSSCQSQALHEILLTALTRNTQFQAIALPKRVHKPLFSRYSVGMQYGKHNDDALMDKSNPQALRTDLAVTVFLNDPDAYDGGELCIDCSLGEQAIKLPAGDAIVYPATTLHRVAPVIRGERLVAVTWVQSYIRSGEQREILFDMDKIRRRLDQSAPKGEETDLAHKTYANLLRQWAEV